MKTHQLKMTALALTLCLGLCGCKTISGWFKSDPRDYVIGIFDFQWEPEEGNRLNAVEYGGKTFYLKAPPVLSSAFIQRVESFSVKGGVGLKLHLSRHGMMRWHQASAVYRGKQLAIMFDDRYRGALRVQNINDSGVITLRGPYNAEEVEKIKEHAEKNFRH